MYPIIENKVNKVVCVAYLAMSKFVIPATQGNIIFEYSNRYTSICTKQTYSLKKLTRPSDS